MKQPNFLRSFPSQEDEEKEAYKRQLKETGSEYKKEKQRLETEKLETEKQLGDTELEFEKKEHERSQTEERLDQLSRELSTLRSATMGAVLHFFKIRSIESSLKLHTQEIEQLRGETDGIIRSRDQLIVQIEKLQQEIELAKESITQDAKTLVIDFFESRKEAWQNAEYTPEEAEKLFTEDHLSNLSLEEYVLLLKRFPSHMVTHVTRQGVRDHFKMLEHSSGVGETHNGFKAMLENGRMLNPLFAAMESQGTDTAVSKMIHLNHATTKKQAIESLESFLNPQNTFASYVDRNAIHFASEIVADEYYGAETGNEIFVTFPSMLVDTQYAFVGDLSLKGNDQYNNQWVWTKNEQGMDLNAGIIFIPEDAQVDPETGSRYKIDNGAPVEDEELLQTVREAVTNSWITEYATLFDEAQTHYNPGIYKNALIKKMEEHGVLDLRIQSLFLNPRLFKKLRDVPKDEKEWKNILSQGGVLYSLAERTESSKDYWERYFNDHPEQRPSKTVFYRGGDPSNALRQFKEEHQLSKQAELGSMKRNFADEEYQEAAGWGSDRFREIAMRLIEEKFSDEILSEKTEG